MSAKLATLPKILPTLLTSSGAMLFPTYSLPVLLDLQSMVATEPCFTTTRRWSRRILSQSWRTPPQTHRIQTHQLVAINRRQIPNALCLSHCRLLRSRRAQPRQWLAINPMLFPNPLRFPRRTLKSVINGNHQTILSERLAWRDSRGDLTVPRSNSLTSLPRPSVAHCKIGRATGLFRQIGPGCIDPTKQSARLSREP